MSTPRKRMGRPPAGGRKDRVQVLVSHELAERLRAAGGGSLKATVVIACEQYLEGKEEKST